MSGGIIMAGVPGNAWRAPAASKPALVPVIIGGAAVASGVSATAIGSLAVTTAGSFGAIWLGTKTAAYLKTHGGSARDEERRRSKIPPYRPPSDFGTRTQYETYQALRRNSMPENRGKTKPELMKQPPGPPKAPTTVGCKAPTEYTGASPRVEERYTYHPRHRGQLGQNEGGTYLTNGARPDEHAPKTKHTVLVEPDPMDPRTDFDVPKPPKEPVEDCNPRVQTGPGREMAP